MHADAHQVSGRSLNSRRSNLSTAERGNARFLAECPTPESRSSLEEELKSYLPEAELHEVMAYVGDKATLILRRQYDMLGMLYRREVISEYMLMVLTNPLE